MKLTSIVIGPAGFSGIEPNPDPDPEPTPEEPLLGLFVVTQEYTDDFEDVIFAVRCLDPVTGEVLGTWKNTDPGAPKSDGDTLYQLYGCKVVGGRLYVMAKGSNGNFMNTHQVSMGPSATIEHDDLTGGFDRTWALIKFTTQDLSDPEEIVLWHPDGNYYAPAAGGFEAPSSTYDAIHSILELYPVEPDDLLFTQILKPGTGSGDGTGCQSPLKRCAMAGYDLPTGERQFLDDQGPVGFFGGSVERQAHSWCIGPDGTFYSVGSGNSSSAPNDPHQGQVWRGIHSDPFQELIYDGGGTTGPAGSDSDNRDEIDWLCIDPESGDIFLHWYGGAYGAPQCIDRISNSGVLLDTYVLSTTAFTPDWSQSTGICPAMVARNGKLYCSTDLCNNPNTLTIEGGIWIIDVSDGSGQDDPAYYFGGPGGGQGPVDTIGGTEYFGEGLLYGMDLGV